MKNYANFLYVFFLFIIISSCSSDNSLDPDISNQFPMTAKINGVLFEMTNPFGTNEATSSIFNSYYPNSDYIQLQGWSEIDINSLGIEIDIWINRNDLKVGTYTVGIDTEDVATHIDLIDLRTNPTENTVSGSITITSIDTTAKIVKGTFEFDAADSSSNTSPINSIVTEGAFNYKYDTF